MSVNHSVSDLATIIRNGYMVGRKVVKSPVSSLRENVLKILKEEGYILNYSKIIEGKFHKFDIHLKYHLSSPVVSEISVVSTPGRRMYCCVDDIPVVKNGLGMVIMSTSKGVVPDYVARDSKVGGEILLKIF
ncbi:MAG: small subunit ribosomal protein S8 [Lentimonas sp.]|jgi:small subunit ribosomal protein S8